MSNEQAGQFDAGATPCVLSEPRWAHSHAAGTGTRGSRKREAQRALGQRLSLESTADLSGPLNHGSSFALSSGSTEVFTENSGTWNAAMPDRERARQCEVCSDVSMPPEECDAATRCIPSHVSDLFCWPRPQLVLPELRHARATRKL